MLAVITLKPNGVQMKTLQIALLIATFLPASLFAQQSDVEKQTSAEERISRLEERVKELESIIERLKSKTSAEESPDNATRYAEFKKLQTEGAIVRIAPAAGISRESTLPMDIAFFPIPTDDGVRLGNNVYPIADAVSKMLKWKKIANDNGVKNVQMWVVTDDMRDPTSERLLQFGVKNFTAAGSENLNRYNKRWAETMKSFE